MSSLSRSHSRPHTRTHTQPTAAHYFARLLHEKGKLLRVFTQNIDTLERIAGVPDDVIVEAHGSFASATCIDCGAKYSLDFVKSTCLASLTLTLTRCRSLAHCHSSILAAAVFSDQIPHCTNAECSGVVKPDIVFFGEGLPDRFHTLRAQDFPQCDLLIVMGTSLAVQPFASLVNHVPDETPRLLLNMEAVGVAVKDDFIARLLGESKGTYEQQARSPTLARSLACPIRLPLRRGGQLPRCQASWRCAGLGDGAHSLARLGGRPPSLDGTRAYRHCCSGCCCCCHHHHHNRKRASSRCCCCCCCCHY